MAAAHVQDFINELWPQAVAVGDAYGIDPITIVTQAAIESRWGQEVAGNNYFGVKSHGRPGGQVVTTHEEIDGKRVKVQDNFRVYDSMAESVEDYARFLHENPRYAGALKETGFEKQLAGITGAGYATDSGYLDLVTDVSKMVARAAPLTPPGSIPNTVGSQLDVVPPAPKVAPTPEPRILANAARANAEINRPQPATMSPAMAATRAGGHPQRQLPTIGPTGIIKADGIGSMPSMNDMVGIRAAAPSQPAAAPPLVQRPQSYVGQDRAVASPSAAPPAAAAPSNVAAAMPEKYLTTYEKKEIPLGKAMHKGSRDSVAQTAAGQATAETMKTVNRKVTTLNPAWVEAQPKPAAPAVKAPTVGRPAEPAVEEGLGQQIVGGIRTAVGLPREGIGGQLLGGIRSAIGIPADGFGPGIARGFQRLTTGIGNNSSGNSLGGKVGNGGRTPISQQQIASAQANRSDHNEAALAAISRGEKSYTDANGSRQPTVAMNGKVRVTWAD